MLFAKLYSAFWVTQKLDAVRHMKNAKSQYKTPAQKFHAKRGRQKYQNCLIASTSIDEGICSQAETCSWGDEGEIHVRWAVNCQQASSRTGVCTVAPDQLRGESHISTETLSMTPAGRLMASEFLLSCFPLCF